MLACWAYGINKSLHCSIVVATVNHSTDIYIYIYTMLGSLLWSVWCYHVMFIHAGLSQGGGQDTLPGEQAQLWRVYMHHVWQEVDEWKQLGQLRSVSIAMATKSFAADLNLKTIK